MKRFILLLILVLSLSSCTPPKHKIEYLYKYNEVKTYSYSINIIIEGIVSYMLLSFNGKVKISSDIDLNVYQDSKGVLYTLNLNNIEFNLPFEYETIKQFLPTTNLVISFYMDEKGNKTLIEKSQFNQLLLIILDTFIPPLPETDTTNEMRYKVFYINLENTSLRNEISNITTLTSLSPRTFSVNTLNQLTSLEMENKDIIVANIISKAVAKITDSIITESDIDIESKTLIPIFNGSNTKVISFKGKIKINSKLKNIL